MSESHNPHPLLVFRYLREHGAATMVELKSGIPKTDKFRFSSNEMRRSVGHLMDLGLVMVVAVKRAPYFMLVDGQRGSPSPMKCRADAENEDYVTPAIGLREAIVLIQQSMLKTRSDDSADQTAESPVGVEKARGKKHHKNSSVIEPLQDEKPLFVGFKSGREV